MPKACWNLYHVCYVGAQQFLATYSRKKNVGSVKANMGKWHPEHEPCEVFYRHTRLFAESRQTTFQVCG